MRNFFRTKLRIFLLLSGVFLVLEALMLYALFKEEQADVNNYTVSYSQDIAMHIKTAERNLNAQARIMFDTLVNKQEVLSLMYKATQTTDKKELAKLRKQLYRLQKPVYKYLVAHHVRQFHFHLPKSVSFLRFHKKNNYGDSLEGVRYAIDFVNSYKTPISAYEEGRIFNGFRNVFPLFYEDKFVGTVEISYAFSALQYELLTIDESSYMFVVNQKEAHEKLFTKERYRYSKSEFKGWDYDVATLMDISEFRLKNLRGINKRVAKSLDLSTIKHPYSFEYHAKGLYSKKDLLISAVPVYDLDGNVVAFILHYDFANFLENMEQKYIIIAIVMSFGLLFLVLLFGFVLLYGYKKEKEALHKATHDHLTKVLNRHAGEMLLSKEIENFHRYGTVFSLIFFDIDFFKKINDTYGHEMGDYVLRRLVEFTQDLLRKSDIFIRWGGEEFLIILPNTSLKDAINVAEKLREGIQTSIFEGVDVVTCSFGVTEIQKEDKKETIFKRVDTLLYKAKENGRNRVESGFKS